MATKFYGNLMNRLEEGKQFCGEITVGTGMTEYHWSDRTPYEVVAVLCDKTATVLEPVAPVPDKILNGLGWHDVQDCGACGNQLRTLANFCDVCGRAVKKGE